ncbi:redoxin domain-containing protein [Paucibacter sp. APW11]|uniref:Redoxin domain-containing protein n=1 Tax=Roseateles aquae TaxID=3077235 RepID=A0ABU3P573_9BURK|nr:redoxin domain-containing protein [Paucibacter sp. APW11]MDT8997714.1 redoxin domain-containing protein [Paucibacter sp. APW11]
MATVPSRIQPHSSIAVALRMPLAGLWIALRFAVAPLLWLRYRSGSRMDWAYAVDTFFKRQFFPLTEASDELVRDDVNAAPHAVCRQVDGPAPAGVGVGWPEVAGRAPDLKRFAAGRPLLLILFRGTWCPYSRLHLTDLATVAAELESLGVAVLAVSAREQSRWWHAHGVKLPFAVDPDGDLFRSMRVRIEPGFAQRAWGLLLPHESVFLFNERGELLVADVRRLNSTKTRQTFLSSAQWLQFARGLAKSKAAMLQCRAAPAAEACS